MKKDLGITALLTVAMAVALAASLTAVPADAEACKPMELYTTPPPAPAPRYAVPPPGAPVVVPGSPLCPLTPVRVQCQSPNVPCTRVVYRYVCRTRTRVVRRCPPYRRYYRAYSRPPVRRYRRPRVYRNLSPYHPKSTPYLGIGGGFLSFIKPTGGYEHLQAVADTGAFFGWNFGGIFALELGLSNTFYRPDKEMLGNVSRVGLVAVTLDTKLRLVKPSPKNWAVPFLQAGLGVYTLAGGVPSDCGGCKTKTLAHGGGLQVGGGVDFYLNRYVILGARVLYRHLFMSELQGAGDRVFRTGKPNRLHAVSGGLTLTTFWSHL